MKNNFPPFFLFTSSSLRPHFADHERSSANNLALASRVLFSLICSWPALAVAPTGAGLKNRTEQKWLSFAVGILLIRWPAANRGENVSSFDTRGDCVCFLFVCLFSSLFYFDSSGFLVRICSRVAWPRGEGAHNGTRGFILRKILKTFTNRTATWNSLQAGYLNFQPLQPTSHSNMTLLEPHVLIEQATTILILNRYAFLSSCLVTRVTLSYALVVALVCEDKHGSLWASRRFKTLTWPEPARNKRVHYSNNCVINS